MANHPNRSKLGRPALAPAERRQQYAVRLAPDVLAAAKLAGRPRVEAILRVALLPFGVARRIESGAAAERLAKAMRDATFEQEQSA